MRDIALAPFTAKSIVHENHVCCALGGLGYRFGLALISAHRLLGPLLEQEFHRSRIIIVAHFEKGIIGKRLDRSGIALATGLDLITNGNRYEKPTE